MTKRAYALLAISLLIVPIVLRAQDQDEGVKKIEEMSGKEIFTQFCSRCHGEDGKGNIPEELIQNMDAPPPDLTDPYFNSSEKRSSWFHVIKYGGSVEGLSMSMPAWDEALSDKQIEELVEYVKSFVPDREYPQGELNFLRAHYASKAFVEQEALLIPTYTSRLEGGSRVSETSTLMYYANRFGNRFQYEVKLPFATIEAPGRSEKGIGDLELGLKYAVYDDYKKLMIFSAGLEADLPTGNEGRGLGSGTVIGVPYVAAGMGIRNCCELQASAELDAPFNRSKADPELNYACSLTFLLTDSKQGIFPGMELAGAKDLASDEYTVSLVPKVYLGLTKRGHVGVSLGSEIPVFGNKPFETRWLAFLMWDYADGGLWW